MLKQTTSKTCHKTKKKNNNNNYYYYYYTEISKLISQLRQRLTRTNKNVNNKTPQN